MGAPISIDAAADLQAEIEADDGVIDVTRLIPHLSFNWMALPAGPRRWAPVDVSVEIDRRRITIARATYRTHDDRVVIVAGAHHGIAVNWLAERLATPLLFAHHRKTHADVPPAAILAALQGEPVWNGLATTGASAAGGWRAGRAGVGARPVHLATRIDDDGGRLILAGHGIAAEELSAVLPTLQALSGGGKDDVVHDMQVRHRRALAQRWWDAPRTPWLGPASSANRRGDLRGAAGIAEAPHRRAGTDRDLRPGGQPAVGG